MTKRLLSILLIVCMLLTMLPVSALAAQPVAEGTQISNPFADIKASDWYFNAVQYARVNGFFGGVSSDRFAPQGTMTRGMFVTVLGRMAGVDPANYTDAPEFSDVAADAWYAPYVQWAAKYGITTGIGGGKFAPERLISREEMAVFFVRYLTQFSVTVDTGANYDTLPSDLEEISSWAREAVLTLWKTGLLAGSGGRFDPKGSASRAQAATLCMRMDKGVDTWYSEPGVPSTRVSIDPADETARPEAAKKPASGSNSGNSGGTTTKYYEVETKLGNGITPDGVTLLGKGMYASGTRISAVQTPDCSGRVFLGWYLDADMTEAVSASSTITKNMTLYAKMGEVTAQALNETPNYVTVQLKAEDVSGYTFQISGYESGCIESFVNVTANNAEFSSTGPNAQYRYTVSSDGVVTPALEQGQTYRVELAEDSAATFAGKPQSVRVLNIITEKAKVENLKLDGSVKYLSKSDVSGMTESLNGLFRTSLDQNAEGKTQPVEQVEQSGSFTYTGSGLSVGDTVAIYEGTCPGERTNDTNNDGAIVYVEITRAAGNTYTYRTADAEDVLFTPDVLPVQVPAAVAASGSITVPKAAMDFTDDKYVEMGLGSQTTVDAGDFLAFYIGDLGNAESAGYGRIDSVREEDSSYIITYTAASQSDVLAAMDLYSTRNEKIELTQEQIDAIEKDMETQAIESGFVEEAAQYLTELAVQTEGFQELSDDLAADMKSYSVTYADGTPVGSDMSLMAANHMNITGKHVSAKVAAGKVLQHFDSGSWGVRVELTISFTATVGKIEINFTAVFEQEVLLSLNTSGGAIWKWKWIFPYIYDYQLNANIDLGTYTGIGITATAKTAGDQSDDKFDWKSASGTKAEEKILNIGKQITELMEDKETFLGEKLVDEDGEEAEWAGTVGGGLAEKYSAMMENAEESWLEIFRKEIFSQEGSVDPLHILCYGVSADFVVKANLYVTIGMTFSYSVAKRYNFSIKLFHKQSTNEVIDLEEANYNFDFYVMGTIGIRAGIELEVGVGLFSLKLDSIGICAEVGAYAQLWGYFYYHLSWSESGGRDSSCSGAMVIEIGLYLTITFKAQLFSSDKLTYQPVLYDRNWPLVTIGSVENVFDFAYDDDDDRLEMDIVAAKNFTLPSNLFDMKYMDMKSGDIYGDEEADKPAKNFDTVYGGSDGNEKNFTMEFSNPKFRYSPHDNLVIVQPGSSVDETCEVTITWKNGTLAFTSRPIRRTLTIHWSNPQNTRYIQFETEGGNSVGMISGGVGEKFQFPKAPTKTGYHFDAWYLDAGYTSQPFNAGAYTTLPASWGNIGSAEDSRGIKLYARWLPNTNTKYTVEHYQQELNGRYTLTLTENPTGTTDSNTSAAAKSWNGFTAKVFSQAKIAPDGSTVIQIYYERNKYTVTFTYGEMRSADNADLSYTAKYGATLYAPIMALGGYDFAGYYSGGTRLTLDENGGFAVRGDVTYAAHWAARPDTPYRVEHYTQRSDGEGYLLSGDAAIEAKTGETGASITLSSLAKAVDGLTYQYATVDGKQVETAQIAGSGKTVIKLFYARRTYTLRFDCKGGSDIAAIDLPYGKVITLPTPVRIGYTFDGWFTDEAYTAPFTAAAMPAADVQLYARWTANGRSYTVRHYVQDANGQYQLRATDEGLTATTGATLTLSELVKNDLLIPNAISYKEGKVGSQIRTTYEIPGSGDVVIDLYYARAQYTLTWTLNGGTASGSYTRSGKVYYDAPITAPTLTRTGYTYVWDTTPAAKMPAANTTYGAVWTANTYTVTLNPNGGTIESGNVTGYAYGTGVTLPTKVTRTGYTFAGWYENESLTGSKTTSISKTASGDKTFYAKWTANTYTVTLNANGGRISGTTVNKYTYGVGVTLPTNVNRTGYAFMGWYASEDLTGEAVTAISATDIGNKTFYAKWDGAANTAYTVEYYQQNADDNRYTKVDSKTLYGKTDTTVTAPAATYEHFTLCAGEPTVSSGVVRADGSLVLKLYYQRETVTVTFDPNGGELGTDGQSKTFRYGQTFAATAPHRTGYAFDGWYTADGSRYTQTTVTQSTALTAHWSASQVNYTVRQYVMDTNGDYQLYGAAEIKTAMSGTSVALNDLKASGIEVEGGIVYKEAKRNGVLYGSATVVIEGDMVIDLYYERIQYRTYWNAWPGKFVENNDTVVYKSFYYGAELVAPEVTSQYKVFDGWYLDNVDYTQPLPYTTMPVLETTDSLLCMYSKWTARQVTYTAEHYVMDINGVYHLKETEQHTGAAGSTVEIAYSGLRKYSSDYYAASGRGIGYKESKVNDEAVTEFQLEDGLVVQLYYERKAYTLTWYSLWSASAQSGTVCKTETLYYGAPIVPPANPTRNGFTFANWWFGNKTLDETTTMTYQNQNVVPGWTAIEYTLTLHNLEGVTNTKGEPYDTEMRFTYNTSTGEPRTIGLPMGMQKYGYKIGELVPFEDGSGYAYTEDWYYDEACTQPVGIDANHYQVITIDRDIDLWLKIEPKQINICIRTGSSTQPDPLKVGGTEYPFKKGSYEWVATVPFGSTITLPSTYDAWAFDSGYEFDYWTRLNQTEKINTFTISELPTYYGGSGYSYYFEPHAKARTYNLTIDLNGGTPPEGHEYPTTWSWDAYSSLEMPIRTGYTFTGWTGDTGKTEPVRLVAPKMDGTFGHKSFRANWTPYEYKITYVLNGGTLDANTPGNYTIETPTFQLVEPSRENFSFLGWYTTKTFEEGTQITQITQGSTGHLKLYAKWGADVCTITYELNGGENNSKNPETVDKGTTVRIYYPTRYGYTFAGWSTQPSGAASMETTYTVTSDLTLYAHWETGTYNVKFFRVMSNATSDASQEQSGQYEATITLPEPYEVSNTNVKFVGWYDDISGRTMQPGEKYTIPGENVWLQAMYEIQFTEISTPAQLSTLAIWAAYTEGKTYTLKNDISMGSTLLFLSGFAGTFDGAGHKITLCTSQWNFRRESKTPLFGRYLGSSATVKNLTVVCNQGTIYSDGLYWGVLAGENYGTIENVCVTTTNEAGLKLQVESSAAYPAIGLVAGACLDGGRVIDCSIGEHVSIVMDEYPEGAKSLMVGSLVGLVGSGNEDVEANRSEVRFTSGYTGSVRITVSVNDADVDKWLFVGGLLGRLNGRGDFVIEKDAPLTLQCEMTFQKAYSDTDKRYEGVLIGYIDEGGCASNESDRLSIICSGLETLYRLENENSTASGFDDVTVTAPTAGS